MDTTQPVHHRLTPEEEKELVLSAQRDLHQFKVLYDRYFSQIYHYCYYHTFDRVMAEDLTSEVFLKALKAFKGYKWKEIPFGAWLQRIASNHVKNYYRDKKATISIDDAEPMAIAEHFDPIERLSDLERKLVVRELLKKMDYACEELIILRFYKELSYELIGQQVDKSVAACKMQLRRCLDRMKSLMGKESVSVLSRHVELTAQEN